MRLSAIGAADTGFSNCNSLIISFSFATHSNQKIYTARVSAFSFYLKKKTPAKEKQNCAHNKASKHRLKVSLFCAMPRKKRLKCGRIPARLFLACHQKSNTFKCKQFCCAKPMCAYLSVGCPPVPRNATPQYLACESQLVARHIRTQTRRSLNGCVLVRLASQAVPSLSSVCYYCCGTAIISLIIKAA